MTCQLILTNKVCAAVLLLWLMEAMFNIILFCCNGHQGTVLRFVEYLPMPCTSCLMFLLKYLRSSSANLYTRPMTLKYRPNSITLQLTTFIILESCHLIPFSRFYSITYVPLKPYRVTRSGTIMHRPSSIWSTYILWFQDHARVYFSWKQGHGCPIDIFFHFL